jgi:hypothetical protein
MVLIRILKPGLFTYECVRTFVLAVTLVFLLPETTSSIPWLAFAAPGVLFPLMALFIMLDVSRYKVYLPLFIAGKFACIFSLLSWSLIFGNNTIAAEFHRVPVIVDLVFFSGDLFALAAVLLIFNSTRKLSKKPVLEDEQCE